MNNEASRNLAKIASAFSLPGDFQGGEPYGSGHINDTFVVNFSQSGAPVRYILQRINDRVFQDVPALMDNILRVTSYIGQLLESSSAADRSRRCLTLLPALDGKPYFQDDAGDCWRCYLFIEKARTYDLVESTDQAYAAAKAFGDFQRLLAGMSGKRLHETIPYFHHTRRRFETLEQAVKQDACGRAHSVHEEIDFAFERKSMTGVLLDLLERGEIPERIAHNDTKFNNVMIDDATQEGICVIDLDTVMPGSSLYDFGDMVRSVTNSAKEDEQNLSLVGMRMPYYEQLLRGFLAGAGSSLNDAECAHLAFAGKLMTFETGIRFLTDYLQGDVYFKTHRPGHNLDRCRNQFALLRSMEAQEPEMNALMERIRKEGKKPTDL